MIPLFSDQGRMQIDRIVRPGVLCAFDFDGTLSPFTGYENASLPQAIREKLVRLQSMTPVAILTGRALPDIRARLDFKPDYLVANHGQEGVPGKGKDSEKYRGKIDCWAQILQKALADSVRYDRGIRLDNKRYSLAVHYRKAADYDETESGLTRLFAEAVPEAHVLPGKFVYNLIPPGAPDKGDALLELMKAAGSRTAVYVGDDWTDEDVFSLESPDILTIRIEKKPESHARFYLETQKDIARLLDLLIDKTEAAMLLENTAAHQRKLT